MDAGVDVVSVVEGVESVVVGVVEAMGRISMMAESSARFPEPS